MEFNVRNMFMRCTQGGTISNAKPPVNMVSILMSKWNVYLKYITYSLWKK